MPTSPHSSARAWLLPCAIQRAGITNPYSRFDSISRNPDGSIQIVLEGYRNGAYVVEASVDLNTWTPVSTNRVRGGRILIEDRRAAEVPMQFYRVRQP